MTRIRFDCRHDRCAALIEYGLTGAGREQIVCPRCGREYELHDTASLVPNTTLAKCAMCQGEELFIRKDFPQKTGLVIVVVAAVISILFLKSNPGIAYGVLVAALLVDLLIYYMIGVVTVCYRCRTEHRGQPRNANHDWFDLASSEKYQ